MLEAIGIPHADKTQLVLFAATKPTSGGYKNNLGALRNQGALIDYPSPGTVALADTAGRSRRPAPPPAAPQSCTRSSAGCCHRHKWRSSSS